MKNVRFCLSACLLMLTLSMDAYAAVNIPLTVNLSETVNVTGTPRIAVDVGGTTRYATYSSGTGTNALTFTLAPQAGDVDLDGVTVSSPIDLNGGTITDTKGNNLSSLTFTPPSTTNVKVNYPSLGMDFVYDSDGRYTLNGTVYNDLASFLSATGGTFTRASIGTYYDSTGTLQTAASGLPRFDYDPVTHAAKGLLIEESRSNLLTYSMTMNTAPWNLARSSVTLGATTSPDGTANAIKFYNNGTAGGVYAGYWRTYTANQTYTYSIFAKKAEVASIVIPIYAAVGWIADGNVAFNLNTGTASVTGTGISSYSITPLPNGWYRCAITGTFGTTDTYGQYPVTMLSTNPMDSVSGVYLWGAQLEQGSFPTSYIPTTTAAVMRATDILSIPTASWFSISKSTLFLEATAFGRRSFGSFGTGFGSNSSNYFAFPYISTTGFQGALYYRSGGTGPVLNGTPTLSFNTLYKTAGSYSVPDNVASYAKNGALSATGSGVSAMSSATTLYVGTAPFNSSSATSGHYQKLKYYPTRVTDTQLELLTQ